MGTLSDKSGSLSNPITGSLSKDAGSISYPTGGTISTPGDAEAGTYLLWSAGSALLWAAGDNRIQYTQE